MSPMIYTIFLLSNTTPGIYSTHSTHPPPICISSIFHLPQVLPQAETYQPYCLNTSLVSRFFLEIWFYKKVSLFFPSWNKSVLPFPPPTPLTPPSARTDLQFPSALTSCLFLPFDSPCFDAVFLPDDHHVLQLHPEGHRGLAARGQGHLGAHQDHHGSPPAKGATRKHVCIFPYQHL